MIVYFLRQKSSPRLHRRYLDPNIVGIPFFFVVVVLEQMRLFLMIPSVLTEISFLVPGIEILPIVLKIEAEAGGMATIVIVLFGQISTVFIGVVEMKPGPISSGQN